MKKLFVLAIVLCLLMAGCTDTKSRSTGVYMLLDTSGTYAVELKKAQKILNYLLGTLAPGDTLAVARIDTGSFSEKDIVSKVTLMSGRRWPTTKKGPLCSRSTRLSKFGERQPLHRYIRRHITGYRILKRSRFREKIHFDFLGS